VNGFSVAGHLQQRAILIAVAIPEDVASADDRVARLADYVSGPVAEQLFCSAVPAEDPPAFVDCEAGVRGAVRDPRRVGVEHHAMPRLSIPPDRPVRSLTRQTSRSTSDSASERAGNRCGCVDNRVSAGPHPPTPIHDFLRRLAALCKQNHEAVTHPLGSESGAARPFPISVSRGRTLRGDGVWGWSRRPLRRFAPWSQGMRVESTPLESSAGPIAVVGSCSGVLERPSRPNTFFCVNPFSFRSPEISLGGVVQSFLRG
jgi:hypothetical protein